MQRLKESFPKHHIELSLTMADYYREHAAFSKAWDEYQAVEVRSQGLHRDPNVYLNQADTLIQLGRHSEAAERLYIVLANEYAYLRAEDENGNPRQNQELQRNKFVVQNAYLTLGRLYNEQLADIKDAEVQETSL